MIDIFFMLLYYGVTRGFSGYHVTTNGITRWLCAGYGVYLKLPLNYHRLPQNVQMVENECFTCGNLRTKHGSSTCLWIRCG